MFWTLGQENLASDLVRLHLNGQFHGLYLAQESANTSWLRRRGFNETAEIFKASVGGQGVVANLAYSSALNLYPSAYDRRGDGLGSYDSLIAFTYDMSNTPEAAFYQFMMDNTELDDWLYRWTVEDITANADYSCNNFYVVYGPENPGKWQIFHFDSDMCFGCQMFLPPEKNCGMYDKSPLCCATYAHSRIAANNQLRNRLLVIYKDVLENYFTEEKLFGLINYYHQKSVLDRADEAVRWSGDFQTTMDDEDLINVRNWFRARRSYLLGWLAGQSITPPANAHPTISLAPPILETTPSGKQYVITWTYQDPESDTCMVDLYWWDRGWSLYNPIEANIPAAADSFTWTANVPDIPEENLFIHAVIRDGKSYLVGRDTTTRPAPIYDELVGDINGDGKVNISDLMMLAQMWLAPNGDEVSNPRSWDLSQGWSNTSNPHGPWTYEDTLGQILPYQAGGTIGGGLAGWANSAGSTPTLFKGAWGGTSADQVQGHGPWVIVWTSPFEGYVTIEGYLWQMYETSRRMKWVLTKNGLAFSSGQVPVDAQGNTLLGPNYTVYFNQGAGGPAALVQQVNIGDTIMLQGIGSGPEPTPTFAPVGFRLTETVGAPAELDLCRDNRIDLKDYAVLAHDWLKEN
jgi:hypothetical protein